MLAGEIKNAKSDRQEKGIAAELGGNAGVIVNHGMPDINTAAAKIAIGGFAQAAKLYISAARIYTRVHF